jgi:uncharacterized protein with ParB-like and HNH nuclease domain
MEEKMQIRQIIDKINDYQLFVPAFQREYVWKRPDAKALFASLIKKYPTGTLLTWDTAQPPELKGDKKFHPEMGAVKLILDGQQRITTIYMIMEGKIPPYYVESDIKNSIMNLHVNLETMELEYYKKQQMQNNPRWVDLTEIFCGKIKGREVKKRLKENGGLDNDTEDKIDDNLESIRSIKDRDFPEQIIPVGASVREAIDIFYIVNASGVNLTEAELALAQICGYWPDARKLFKAKLNELEKNGFGFKLDFLIYALLAVIHDVGSDMKRLHSDDNKSDLKEAWKKLDGQVLDYVINIIKTHAYVDHLHEINSPFSLIPIISYVYKQPEHKLSEYEIKKAIKWFYYSQLRQRYISQTPQKLDKDLGIIENSDNPFDELLTLIKQESGRLSIVKGEFVGRDIRHPLFSLMRWYFKSRDAVCLGTGVKLRQNMGKPYALENDHIFPYSELKKNGYNPDNKLKYALAQELTNRAILTQRENRGKSDKAAEKYLLKIKNHYPTALKQQCIPEDTSLWSIDNYEKFLDARREILTEELNEFLEGITQSDLGKGTVDIEDIITEGEHDSLEFKSSLRWDSKQNTYNEVLEKTCLKTLAAFNNGEGGKLIIGVDDEQNILGLENDYSTFKMGGDRDTFEVHLRNIINQEWGVSFAVNNLTIMFHEIGGSEVCVIDVKRGNEPIFVKMQDKNGQKVEKFFVRSGNSSPPIESPSEISAYIKNRFSSV